MQLVIEQEQAQRIIDYLVLRPYGEVAQLINELVQLKPCPAEKKKN